MRYARRMRNAIRVAGVVAMFVGCGGGETRLSAPMRQSDDAEDAERKVEAAVLKERSRLVDMIRNDPVGALTDLGVDVSEFYAVSKALFMRWSLAFPAQAQAEFARSRPAPEPTPAPDPAPSVISSPVRSPPVPIEQKRFWCIRTATFSTCEDSLDGCNRWRMRLAKADYCLSRGGGHAAACIDTAAEIRGVGLCQHQVKAACFSKFLVVQGVTGDDCSPTIEECRRNRRTAAKFKADIKVRSDCKPTE